MNVCEIAIDSIPISSIDNSDEETEKKVKKNRKTSELWNYFTAISREHALCDLCNQKFSYKTSTSNLRKHILCRHKDKKLHSPIDDKSYKVKGENSPMDSHVEMRPEDEIEIHTERIQIKKEATKKSDQPRNSLSNFLTFKKHSWEKDRPLNDEYEAYGVTVAAKLRKMEEKQRLFCERIINEALYKGALDQLTPLSDIVICINGQN